MNEATKTGTFKIDADGIVAGLGRGISSATMAIAELIDNALAAAPTLPGDIEQRAVQVLIRFKQDDQNLMSLVIRDTAAGMSPETVENKLFDYAAENPLSTGLNEFGVGAKEALGFLAGIDGQFTFKTVWFDAASNKRVVTTIGKTSLRDIYPKFKIATRDAEADEPVGTQWTVLGLKGGCTPMEQQTMFARTLGSIYRKPIREGRLILKGEDSLGIQYAVSFTDLDLLKSYPVRSNHKPDFIGQPITWRIDFDDVTVAIPNGPGIAETNLKVSGWFGLLAQLSDTNAGIAIIRRDRLVQMGGGLLWTPKPLYKKAGSHRDKRLIGEIICDGIPTTKVKSEINDSVANPIALALVAKLHLMEPNIISQGDHFRVREYDQAILEHENGGRIDRPSGAVMSGNSTQIDDPDGTSVLRRPIDPPSTLSDHSITCGSFTSPVDSRTFIVVLKSRQKSGSSTEWEWTKNATELEIAVSSLIMQIARSDPRDERLVPYVSLIVALALVDREGHDSEGVIARVSRLARVLKPE